MLKRLQLRELFSAAEVTDQFTVVTLRLIWICPVHLDADNLGCAISKLRLMDIIQMSWSLIVRNRVSRMNWNFGTHLLLMC